MKKHLLIALVLFFVSEITAQVYTADSAKTRHRFAQLNLGLNFSSSPGFNYTRSFSLEEGEEKVAPNINELRFIIGGTHFWGHADFEISIPVIRREAGDNEYTALYSHGVSTSAKLYPLSIQKKAILPYLGLSFNTSNYQQLGPDSSSMGAVDYRFVPRYHGGLTAQFGDYLFGLDFALLGQNEFEYYTDEFEINKVQINPWTFGFSLKKTFDTTLAAEKSWKSGRAQALADSLGRRGELNSLNFALGFSSVLQKGSSRFNQENHPALGKHELARTVEFGLGYYFHRPDIQLNIPFRQYQSEIHAYTSTQRIQRRAVGVEALWFFADYHGFVPFIGPILSYENHQVSHRSLEVAPFEFEQNQWNYGLVLGWDIRPNQLQSLILRTNIRYLPQVKIADSESGFESIQDIIEINFIQLVLYPGRFGKFR